MNMKKELQEMDNTLALDFYRQLGIDVIKAIPKSCKRLRHCQAWVYETPKYYILKSYNTVVAFIVKDKDILVDVLRHVYGYSVTSAQHIAKFNTDYGKAKYGCVQRITYRDI